MLALGLLAVSLTACDSDSNADDGPELDIVATTNGIIHVIDTVLLPPTE